MLLTIYYMAINILLAIDIDLRVTVYISEL